MVKFIRNLIINITVLSVTIVIVILASEVALRVFDLENIGVEDWGTKAKIMRVSKDPQIGLELIPGAKGKTIGVEVSISKEGLRDRTFSKVKPEGIKRVITIGDSITFGYGVERKDSYPKVMEKLLNDKEPGKWEVINFGVPGVNASQYIAALIKRGLEYDPDYVVLGYCLNDVDPPAMNMPVRLAEGTTDFNAYQNKKRSKIVKQGKKLMAWEFPVPANIENRLTKHSAFYRFISKRWDVLLNRYGIRNNNPVISIDDTFQSWKTYFDKVAARYETPLWDIVKSEIEKLKNTLDKRQTGLLVAVFPFEIDIEGEYPYWRLHEKLGGYLGSTGAPFLDLKLVFDHAGITNEELWVGGFDMIHPKPIGHAIAAAAMRDHILKMDSER